MSKLVHCSPYGLALFTRFEATHEALWRPPVVLPRPLGTIVGENSTIPLKPVLQCLWGGQTSFGKAMGGWCNKLGTLEPLGFNIRGKKAFVRQDGGNRQTGPLGF